MDNIEQTLDAWKKQLVTNIPVGGLISRNATVYKWKAPFRVWMLRESVAWRLIDLLDQSHSLYQQQHTLGARILMRSAFESLATLIYLNQNMQSVLDGKLKFGDFARTTAVLLLGSRNNDESKYRSLNIITVLQKCEKRYPGLMKFYADLSESAHPSYEGLCRGYAKIDHDEYETIFSNRWPELYGDQHVTSMELCMKTFEHEYNDVWIGLMDKLEVWMEANDAELEATKGDIE
jgi:hypothetical protein